MTAKLRVIIHWFILSEKCYINMGRNCNRYVVMLYGTEKKKYEERVALF